MEVFDLSDGQARYHVRRAHADGSLPRKGQAHGYTTATIFRGTSREYSWTVCQVCLTSVCALEADHHNTGDR